MRDIIFRGKRIDNGEWVEGFYWTNGLDNYFIRTSQQNGMFTILDFEVDEYTVSQYTDLTDKNGKRIFEGDILKVTSERRNYMMAMKFGVCGGVKNVDCQVGYMGFYFSAVDEHTKECMKYAMRNDPIYYLNSTLCEVIGNIHDNKEFDTQNGEEKEE